ncbi:Lrp/AsnC family transcriptional regulator [Alkaliphilus peptidifermentans]|uniref:Lrp/AsnC family transcriptional regulator, leucine-responsive regulatory protein n=1 Tax=Alkaliphilus peptidifermentans DSM 18978 TaxID=1120976 RepID=A0A1G5KZ57_9FIRM|nr:Lrp/AsnC family transcriptional regulator [Alkaliphilus peptidifermentans]SCZ05229.1 Lrp/AsnC family transcriptional regulator, leucine-responsive regulatory protein [Alkaliphilus peptidifermentans DSM 18978]
MDELDFKILRLLEKNGRMSHEEISKRLNMSRPAIHQRISKLEQREIIKGYSTVIDWTKVGQGIRGIVFINIRTTDFNKIMEQVASLRIEGLTIEKCYRITGQWCIMLEIRTSKTSHITNLHDDLLKIEGMLETFTVLILSEVNKIKSL